MRVEQGAERREWDIEFGLWRWSGGGNRLSLRVGRHGHRRRNRSPSMRLLGPVLGLLVAVGLAGCAWGPVFSEPSANPVLIAYPNPMLVPSRDAEAVWENVVDVVDDYFRIDVAESEPVRFAAGIFTEGRLSTFPEVASTLFEPWRQDSADSYEKIESTLQSIRRQARVRVVPANEGFWIEVAVFKELEHVAHPAHASAGAATFRNDSSLTRVISAVGEQEIHEGWIPLGRDPALEQRILAQLHERFGLALPAVAPAVHANP